MHTHTYIYIYTSITPVCCEPRVLLLQSAAIYIFRQLLLCAASLSFLNYSCALRAYSSITPVRCESSFSQLLLCDASLDSPNYSCALRA